MKTRLENNHVLLAEVQAGLERDEFIYYLQPKCNLNRSEERRVGKECRL